MRRGQPETSGKVHFQEVRKLIRAVTAALVQWEGKKGGSMTLGLYFGAR